MITALAAAFVAATSSSPDPAAVRLSVGVDKIFCLTESSDGIGSDEVYLVTLTHELSGNKFFSQHTKVFEGVDSGERRTLSLPLKSGEFTPSGVIFVVGLGECDNYDETGTWVMGYHHPRGLQCDTNTWGWIAEDIAMESLNKLAHTPSTMAMWQPSAPRAFRVQYMKTELAKALEAGRNDCLGTGEIALTKADLDRARKYPGKRVPIVLLLKGDDAVYQVFCHITAAK